MSPRVGLLLAFVCLCLLPTPVLSEEKQCLDLSVHVSKSPAYPPIAIAAHVQGIVHMSIKVSADAKILSIESVDGPKILEGAARDYVSNWELGWNGEKGKHRTCTETISIDYKLLDAAKGISSYSYEIVTEDGTSSTVVITRPTYYKVVTMY